MDGDTLDLAGTRVRLAGIDAPELHQDCQRDGRPWPCGVAARQALAALLRQGAVSCASSERDVYGRPVARCRIGDMDLSEHMVREELAVAYREPAFATAEAEARGARRGIWAGTFTAPADWRAAHPREPRAPP